MVIASPPEMTPLMLRTTAAAMMITVVTIWPMLLVKLFTLPLSL